MNRNSLSKLRGYALTLLTRREYPRAELARALAKKEGVSSEEVSCVLDELQESGYLSDDRFVEAYVHRYARERGSARLVYELKQKGASEESIQKFFQNHPLKTKELDHAKQVWSKRFKGHQAKTPSDYQKQARFLAYRGFSAQIIRQILKSSFYDDEAT